MSAWGACSLVQIVSTTQSSRTSKTVINRKEAVCAGILSPVFKVPGLCPTVTVSSVDFRLRSLHQKIPVPRGLNFGTDFSSRTPNSVLSCEV
jgi:hypothetical protein